MKWTAILLALLACMTITACQSRDLPADQDEEESQSTTEPESSSEDEEDEDEIILPSEPASEEPEISAPISAPAESKSAASQPAASQPAASKPAASQAGASQPAASQSQSSDPYLAPIQAVLAAYKDGTATSDSSFAPLPSGHTLPKVSSAADYSIANQADWGTGGSIYEYIASLPMSNNTMVMCIGLNKIDGKWKAVGADFIALA